MPSALEALRKDFLKKRLTKEGYIGRMHGIHKILWDYRDFIKDKNVRSVTISKDAVVMTTMDGIAMICDPHDERTVPMEIMNFADYEKEDMDMMKRFLGKNSVVFDIGANIGWCALGLSRCVPRGKIFAFEPIRKTFSCLKQNIALNKAKNIRAYNFALSDKNGIMEFYYDRTLSGAASLRNLHENRKKGKVRCRVWRLDDIVKGLTGRIDFIKCDVEGAELFVMKGAMRTLASMKPALFLEMLRKWSAKFGYHPNDIIGLLGGIGYRCYYAKGGALAEISKVGERTKATNFYFLDKVKHAKLIKELA